VLTKITVVKTVH